MKGANLAPRRLANTWRLAQDLKTSQNQSALDLCPTQVGETTDVWAVEPVEELKDELKGKAKAAKEVEKEDRKSPEHKFARIRQFASSAHIGQEVKEEEAKEKKETEPEDGKPEVRVGVYE